MRVDAEINWLEMARRRALGETGSPSFYRPELEELAAADARRLLESEDPAGWERGMQVTRRLRDLDRFRNGYRWHDATLDVSRQDLDPLLIAYRDWDAATDGTRLVRDAARRIHGGLHADPRVDSVARAMADGQSVEWRGVTLECRPDGNIDVLEGNGRLVALYVQAILLGRRPIAHGTLSVALGTRSSDASFGGTQP